MQRVELNVCYSGRQKLGPSSGDVLSDGSRTLLPIHGKVTLTCQNSFQLQLHLTLCSWAPACVHSTALLSGASLPQAVSLEGTVCASLDWMHWGQCAGAWSGHWLLFDSALGSWAKCLRLFSFAAVNVFMPATQWFQPIDLVNSAHHLQAKIFTEVGKSGTECGCLHKDHTGQVLRISFRCCPCAAREVISCGSSSVEDLGKDLSFLLHP